MMKRFLACFMLVCMLVVVASCDETEKNNEEGTTANTTAEVDSTSGNLDFNIFETNDGDTSETKDEDTSETTNGGGIVDGGANTDDDYGALIPIG